MSFHIKISEKVTQEHLEKIFSSIFRDNYNDYGFIVISFERNINSSILRKHMVDIKKGLSEKCVHKFTKELDYFWLGRFDQQNTTKFHRDNAPSDSFLMLGYEPSKIKSKLSFADYHQLISDKNIPVDKYYELHNPIFKDGETLLQPYIQEIENFNNNTFQIVLLNNSDLNSNKTFGVLHKAEIIEQDLHQTRVINSMMLSLKPLHQSNNISKQEEINFLETDFISK
ncbi:hypothetical protein [uncultured Tenacibaculum sp.]|uniref:hypothetical protein n=1 Tax=uncultured Tenacibaculum sp. TaxID=174713 RepID=UPI002619122B|nr:hypothetical protein [uncultured Tenacibaculum sp.]